MNDMVEIDRFFDEMDDEKQTGDSWLRNHTGFTSIPASKKKKNTKKIQKFKKTKKIKKNKKKNKKFKKTKKILKNDKKKKNHKQPEYVY